MPDELGLAGLDEVGDHLGLCARLDGEEEALRATEVAPDVDGHLRVGIAERQAVARDVRGGEDARWDGRGGIAGPLVVQHERGPDHDRTHDDRDKRPHQDAAGAASVDL